MMEDHLVNEFLEELQRIGRNPLTIEHYRRDLREYETYLAQRADLSFFVDPATILSYYHDLNARRIGPSAIYSKQHAVFAFYEWLLSAGYLLVNTAPRPAMPSFRRLPLAVPSWETLRGPLRRLRNSPHLWLQRDFALIDLAYCSGLRRGELHGANIEDVCPDDGTMRVRGKGSKERLVPLGENAMHDLLYYIYHVRPKLMKGGTTNALFVSWQAGGKRMHLYSINAVFRRLRKRLGLDRSFSPHKLRHAFATDLIRNGAPVQDVSKMLGHVKLETTQIYTRLMPTDLKKCHQTFHPRG